MTTWQIITELVSGANFRWRQFFVILLVLASVFGGYNIWKGQTQIEAAVKFTKLPASSTTGAVTMNVEVTSNGKVLVDGKDMTKTLTVLPNSYEIRILALQEPGVYIQTFQVLMHLPRPVTANEVSQRIIAIHGAEHSYNSYIVDPQNLAFVVNQVSPQGEVTIVANLPKHILTPTFSKKVIYFLTTVPVKSYLVLTIVLPLITFTVLIFMIVRRRQDQIFHVSKKLCNQIPDNSPPAVIGALVDGQVGAREIAATLIDLATRGYIFITARGNGEFTFGKRKSLALETLPELREYERILLSKIFELNNYKSTREDVDMRVGRHIFSRKIAQVYLNVYNETTRLGYFIKNPVEVHIKWRFAGIALFFLGLAGFTLTAWADQDPKFLLFFWVGSVAASSVVIWLSGLMPARSVTGSAVLRKWLQFRNYLSLRAPIEPGCNMMGVFTQLLPYAVVFGLEAEWARRFIRETFVKPDWYESDDRAITLEVFIARLYPIIDYVGGNLARSHEPTVE